MFIYQDKKKLQVTTWSWNICLFLEIICQVINSFYIIHYTARADMGKRLNTLKVIKTLTRAQHIWGHRVQHQTGPGPKSWDYLTTKQHHKDFELEILSLLPYKSVHDIIHHLAVMWREAQTFTIQLRSTTFTNFHEIIRCTFSCVTTSRFLRSSFYTSTCIWNIFLGRRNKWTTQIKCNLV